MNFIERNYKIAVEYLEGKSLSFVGEKYNLSAERIRQIYAKVLRLSLRHYNKNINEKYYLKKYKNNYKDYIDGYKFYLRAEGYDV